MGRQFEVVCIAMDHGWKKLLIPAVGAKESDATNFKGGHLLWKGVSHPQTILLVVIFALIDKLNLINIFAEII